MSDKKYVVVTGASTGIGYGAVDVLIKNGIHVFGSVRKTADAERLQAEFGDQFTPLIFDVTDETAVHEAAGLVREKLNGQKLYGLVNNAGVAVEGPVIHVPISEWRQQLEINVIGMVICIQAFAPLLGADKSLTGSPGRIVNISSVAGKVGGPFLGAYAASKHAVEGLSESLRRELMLYGIDVIIIGPGAVVTPIWDKSEEKGAEQYKETDYYESAKGFKRFMIKSGRKGRTVEDVGALIWTALSKPNPKVRYAIVPNWFSDWVLPRIMPSRVVDRSIAKSLGFIK